MSAPKLLFPVTPPVIISLNGEAAALAVERIFCVGRNYADHAKEMGAEIIRDKPFFFLKGPHAAIAAGDEIPYPPGTENYHFEVELAVVLGRGGFRIAETDALAHVFGYACALDMTRRDLQIAARELGRPWDIGKDVENSAVFAPILPAEGAALGGDRRIELRHNGTVRQASRLDEMIWSVPELISLISRYYHLRPGDVLMTGTPAGVGPVVPGDRIDGHIDGLPPLRVTIGS